MRDWKEVIWALTTRLDPVRDSMMMEDTPIDYLDFASPMSGRCSKMGLDVTNKWPGETQCEWGCSITMDADAQQCAVRIVATQGDYKQNWRLALAKST